VYGVLVNGPIQYGVAFAFLNAARGDQAGPQSSAGLCKVSGSSGQAASRPCISPLAGLYLSRAVHFGALQAEPQKMDSR
jgi:hypothetical protein